jgi:hypothetical protein
MLSLRIYDASNKLVFTGLLPAEEVDLYSWDVGFPEGEYRVEARMIPGYGARAGFRVESVDGEPLEIKIPIRQRV